MAAEGEKKGFWNSEFGKLVKDVGVGVTAIAIGVLVVGAAI